MHTLNDQALFRQQALIGGVWQDAASGATVDVTNPASLSTLGTIPDMSGKETRAAIDAAAEAFKLWKRKLTPNVQHCSNAGLR